LSRLGHGSLRTRHSRALSCRMASRFDARCAKLLAGRSHPHGRCLRSRRRSSNSSFAMPSSGFRLTRSHPMPTRSHPVPARTLNQLVRPSARPRPPVRLPVRPPDDARTLGTRSRRRPLVSARGRSVPAVSRRGHCPVQSDTLTGRLDADLLHLDRSKSLNHRGHRGLLSAPGFTKSRLQPSGTSFCGRVVFTRDSKFPAHHNSLSGCAKCPRPRFRELPIGKEPSVSSVVQAF
jgi:hypothetical protein